jgi:membrane protease YdiL (CAAX protease family)
VTWGLGDFCWIYFAGLVGSVILAGVGYGITGDPAGEPGALTIGLAFAGQFGTWVAGLVFVSRRKGRGSLRDDFGLAFSPRDLILILAGVGLEIVLALMVFPIADMVSDEQQQVVKDLQEATGFKLAVIALFAGLIAPVCEELLFRGLLLRAFQRRVPADMAVILSALVFALAHPALDPSLGTFAIVPALFALGLISGAIAVRRGNLSASIMLHIGFNLLTTATAIADQTGFHRLKW